MLKLLKKKSEAEVRGLFLQAAIEGDFKILKKWIKKVKKMQWPGVLEEALHESIKHNKVGVTVAAVSSDSVYIYRYAYLYGVLGAETLNKATKIF